MSAYLHQEMLHASAKLNLQQEKLIYHKSLKGISARHPLSQRFNFKKHQLKSTFTEIPQNPSFP